MLRLYQTQLVDDIRAATRKVNRVLAVLPTGGGKTQVFCTIAELAQQRGKHVLILVHRKELLDQAIARLRQMRIPQRLINVASIQRRNLPGADLVIVDEAHHATARTWQQKLARYPKVLGFTATPQRLDGKGLSGVFDAMVQGPSVADLMAGGYLSPYRLFCPPGQADLFGVKRRAGDYARDQLEERVNQRRVLAAAVKNWKLYAGGRQTLGFCVSLAHMHHMRGCFTEAGISCDTVDGSMPKTDRDAVIGRFRLGLTKVLLSVDLIGEGFDVPACDCVLLLRPTTSLALHLQQVGRALRPSSQDAVILDCAGNSMMHGLPDEPRQWSLEGQRKERGGGVAPVPVRVCPRCFGVHRPAPVCPFCGHIHQVEQRTLIEEDITLTDRTEEIRKMRREVGQARTREDLMAVAQARGYKRGWVERVMEARMLRRVNG